MKKDRMKAFLYNNRVLLLGCFLILGFYGVLMCVRGCAPFGDKIFVEGDNFSQILPYIQELKHKIANGESLWYTWHIYGGANFYYIFCYVFTTPMILPLYFASLSSYVTVVNIMILIHFVLMFLSMVYYLTHRVSKSRLDKNQPEVLLFGLVYTLLPAVINMSCYYVYLGTFIVLPLLILGLERFVANVGWRLYFITLVAMVFMNIYLAGMACIFIVLYYLTLYFKNFKEFVIKSLKIIGLSVCALLVAAVFLLPIIMVYMNGGYGVSAYEGNETYNAWAQVLSQTLFLVPEVLNGSTYVRWQSNMYFGILLLIFALIYFGVKNVRPSIRLRKLLVLILMILSLNESAVNYVMHLCH